MVIQPYYSRGIYKLTLQIKAKCTKKAKHQGAHYTRNKCSKSL